MPSLKILLVEDGIINQRVASGLLNLHGHDVTIANDGREAVEAHAGGRFDIVLMDVQMPEMDGLEATAIIRRNEQRLGWHTPIIAMTAAAMKGDRERCLEAGMDAYVSKPIVPSELFDVLRRFVSQSRIEPASDQIIPSGVQRSGDPSPGVAERQGVFDPQAAEARIPGGRRAVKQMAELLLDECPRLLGKIEEAIQQQDAEKIRRGAHTLKGSVDIFSARQVVERAFRLEEIGRMGDLGDIDRLFAELSEEVDRLVTALRAWIESE